MENILQSIVKIIIIGVLCEKINVECNRQFLPPPLSYYQNEDRYVQGFVPIYHNQIPIYYQEQKFPNPISYQNMKSYPPSPLFYQNENYIPSLAANPGLRYNFPQVLPYKQSFQESHKPQQKLNFKFSQVQVKNPPNLQVRRPQETSQKKTEVFASNIIVKDEPLSPYYQDDYKNYNDEDYSDNYSDDSAVSSKPCITNSPYRYFQAPKGSLGNGDKYSLCNPNFQPNFGNSVYTVKMPITLLPSRFPPRVEQLIERIQNYFSTYTQQLTPKPQYETSIISTPHTSSENTTQLPTAEVHRKNTTGGNQQGTTSETAIAGDLEQVTEKTNVATIETKASQTPLTIAPDTQVGKESQTEVQTHDEVDELTESVTDAITEKVQSVTEAGSYWYHPVTDPILSGNEKPEKVLIEENLQSTETTPAEGKNNDVAQPNTVTSSNG